MARPQCDTPLCYRGDGDELETNIFVCKIPKDKRAMMGVP
jgi:hypothetical protein